MNSHDLGAKFSAQARLLHVYVAGPMTGIPDFNFPAFNAEAAKLRDAGFCVENPAEHGIWEGAEWQDYLRYDLTRLAICDQIHLLPGWSKSKGACLELHIAKALGMLVSYSDGAELVPAGQREAFEVFAIPVRENGKRKTFYTEVLPFVPGPGVEVLGEPVRMVAAQSAPVENDAFAPGSLADLLFQLGEKGVGVSGGTHGDRWRVSLPQTVAAQSAPAGEREALWQLIHDTLRNYRMSTLVDEDGDGYPLIDAFTADSQPVSGGMEECIYLADAIWNAIEAAQQRTQAAGVPEDLRAAMLTVIDRSDWRTAANRAELHAMLATAPAQPAVHPDDAAVDRFAAAMKAKLAKAREKGRGGWDDPAQCSVEFLAKLLVGHIGKGNAGTFEDVANFAMMLHQRGADPQVLAREAAAQSAPAGEREAFEAAVATIDPSEVERLDGIREGWEAYASWQRTQAAGAPEGWRSSLEDAALMLEAHSPGSGSVESYAAQDIRAMLAAAPAQPAVQVEQPIRMPARMTCDDGYPSEDSLMANAYNRALDDVIRLNAASIAQTAPQSKFRMGDLVKKSTGSEWEGRVVGWYSTEQTKEGYAVESSTHRNSVQIYPAKALEAVE